MDTPTFFAFFLVFVRAGAMLMASPFMGRNVPVQVRVWLSAAVALAFMPVVKGHLGPVPTDLYSLVYSVGYEALMGIVLGFCLQAFAMAGQMAGSYLDVQLGIGSAQVLNPTLGIPVSILSQFKFMLVILLLFLSDAHLLMFQAFIASFGLGHSAGLESLPGMSTSLTSLVGQLGLLSLQMAAPVAAVCLVVDCAAALVNKAVPQMQVFQVMVPAKSALGIIALAMALPIMVVVVKGGVTMTFNGFEQLFAGGR